jgi:molecular chaperone HscB
VSRLDDDDFTLFDLPATFALDRNELDTRRRQLQAEVHPDRFAAEGAAAQRLAMQWAVRINEAHQRLKDPLSRAAYLCEQRGATIDAERNTAMPAAFLMQQMAWREALDDATALPDIQALAAQIDGSQSALLKELQDHLDVRRDAAAAAGVVRALMFVARFRQDIERRLDRLDPNR